MENKIYLGDGLYAEFDGYQIVLKANDFENPSDTVYLDASVFNTLVKFGNDIFKQAEK